MTFVVFISVLMSVYVVKNEKMQDSSRVGWFVVLIIVFTLTALFTLL